MSFAPFGVDVAGIVADAWDGNAEDCTITHSEPGTVDPNHATSVGSPTVTVYAAQGFVSKRNVAGNTAQPTGGGVPGTSKTKTGKTVVILFGDLIDQNYAPVLDDVIAIDGGNFWIEEVDFDGTLATYICTCRGA